jgi:hypothetical protein
MMVLSWSKCSVGTSALLVIEVLHWGCASQMQTWVSIISVVSQSVLDEIVLYP